MVPLAAQPPPPIHFWCFWGPLYLRNNTIFSFDGKNFEVLPEKPNHNHYNAGGIPSYDGNPLAVGDEDNVRVEIFRGGEWEEVDSYPGYVIN